MVKIKGWTKKEYKYVITYKNKDADKVMYIENDNTVELLTFRTNVTAPVIVFNKKFKVRKEAFLFAIKYMKDNPGG